MITSSRVPVITRVTRWYCPNCPVTDATTESRPHTRFHTCAGLLGLTAPLIELGTRCRVDALEREDYVGREVVQVNADGRPISAVVTTRDDGEDCTVLAPCATLRTE